MQLIKAKPLTSVLHLIDLSNTKEHNSNLFTLQVGLAYLHLAALELDKGLEWSLLASLRNFIHSFIHSSNRLLHCNCVSGLPATYQKFVVEYNGPTVSI